MRRLSQTIRDFLIEMDDTIFDEFSLPGPSTSDRHFDASEQDALTATARGYLISLYRRGQITRMQMELIIHYAVSLRQASLTQVELESLVDRLFFATPWDLDHDPGTSFPGLPH